ncbi:hypothetical protein MTX20_37250 [Bradyrhizobium sp. ISRA435]|nr:hypothetical protein MTX20_37250 [Bradyrhizobium sp. ISRA435]
MRDVMAALREKDTRVLDHDRVVIYRGMAQPLQVEQMMQWEMFASMVMFGRDFTFVEQGLRKRRSQWRINMLVTRSVC